MMQHTARRRHVSRSLLLAFAPLLTLAACAASDNADGAAEAGATADTSMGAVVAARIVEPADGAELRGPVRVVLGAENFQVVSAGDTRPNSGHHHLFLNMDVTAEGGVVPLETPGIVHLGQAQTEYTFPDLAPGEYTLVAVVGDFAHRVIPQASDTIRFRVIPQD